MSAIMSANSMTSAKTHNSTAISSQATAEWMKLFSRGITHSYTSSAVFMKQLTVIAVSTITYLKEIFPKENYLTETFGGLQLRILKAKCEDESAQFISTALVQSFEALEKKYLAKLVLCLYEGSCHVDNLVEAHCFEFSYVPAGVSIDVRSAGRDSGAGAAHSAHEPDDARYAFKNIRERTLQLLNNCIVVSETPRRATQEPYDVSLRLYYNSATPAGYQAPGFAPVGGEVGAEARDPLEAALAEAVDLGWLETPFHHLEARSYIRDMHSSYEANASPNVPIMTQNETDDYGSGQQVFTLHTDGDGAGAGPAPAVRCACGPRAPPAADDALLITCDYCGTLQHAVCYGVSTAAPARHCCVRCSDLEPARAPTCHELANLVPKSRETLCLFRHSLLWTARAQRVTARALAERFRLTGAVASKLLRNLHVNGVLHGDLHDLDSPQIVDDKRLNVIMRRYFQSDENTFVDQLLSESLSQEGPVDPVGDMLGPKEQTNLQNATTMGIMIQHTPPDCVVEDSTLKQYREAIFSTKNQTDEELPLSGSHNPVQNMGKREKTVTKRKMDEPDRKPLKSRLRAKKAKEMP